MNAKAIFRRMEEAERALQQVRDCLQEARQHSDQFSAFLFESRCRFRRLLEHDTKSGKRTSAHVRETFAEAQEYGFRGDLGAWASLLDARIPAVDSLS